MLTHQGRSADSGHYIAWVKENDGMHELSYYHIILQYNTAYLFVYALSIDGTRKQSLNSTIQHCIYVHMLICMCE